MAAPRLHVALRPALLGAVLAVLMTTGTAAAQEIPGEARRDTLGPAPARPLILLFGEVRAESLRFHGQVPELEVRLLGNVADTAARAWTSGLPERVRSDTTYRDVRVYFEVYSAIDDVDRWLREALGASPDSLAAPSDGDPPRQP